MSDSVAQIKCDALDKETEVEISHCKLSCQTRPHNPVHNLSMTYKFIFDKNIRYEFHIKYFEFDIDDSGSQTLTIDIYHTLIQFECAKKKCEYIYDGPDAIKPNFQSTNVVKVCDGDSGTLSDIKLICLSLNPKLVFKETEWWIAILTLIISIIVLIIHSIAACLIIYLSSSLRERIEQSKS
ncbi:hypothetical protein RF11_03701 [Thelohanellus kitauei]|uniref:Uncharacterized protein n=1 Tax=Thelohanellus kitauei TaxID=669202 RepID=A0A0C2M7R3_THEKT|nr:hypothetical protein RF11_03701 [Thelohanellus kitauei]